jgi:UDP-N-acetyl-D-mannosaminuronic acid transferase (WecB/TagA/CpsF family)
MEARPDSVWDGLSTSKQEFFKSKHIGGLDFTLMLGVGYAFDIHAGVTKEAPPGDETRQSQMVPLFVAGAGPPLEALSH